MVSDPELGAAPGQLDGRLASLIGSRICHDLISPIGAIANGLELLELSGHGRGPEVDLISDSVTNAGARIRFFRVAFGAAGTQELGRIEILSILDDLGGSARMEWHWSPTEGVPRSEARVAFLALLCLETALPLGGRIDVNRTDGAWHIEATGRKVTATPELWSRLDVPSDIEGLAPAHVQFALLPVAAREAGRRLIVSPSESALSIAF